MTDFQIGREVDKTFAHGVNTLFITGLKSFDEIRTRAFDNQCDHIVVGANASFDVHEYMIQNSVDLYTSSTRWEKLIMALLNHGYTVSLEFDLIHLPVVLESIYNEHDNFIPKLIINLQYMQLLNYNTVVKFDGGKTNIGTWCHNINSIMNATNFNSHRTYDRFDIQ